MPYAAQRHVSAWTSTVLRDGPGGITTGLTQCLWGDWVGVKDLTDTDGWLPVRTRGRDGWLRASELTDERPLEVNFVDIGQGDGTFLVTPDDEMVLVDAGEGTNMHRFLKWRFNIRGSRRAPPISRAVITHPDSDHYRGFAPLFRDTRFAFGTVYHNGIVERAGDDPLGPSRIIDGQSYLTDVVRTRARLKDLLDDDEIRGRRRYPNLLWDALNSGRVDDIRALGRGDEVFPERTLFAKTLSMKVLAPVSERHGGTDMLRWFSDDPGPTTNTSEIGMTKNGHSVVTMLRYGNVGILLGGDLNVPAEMYLIERYGPDTDAFRADVAKACHHGSADFTTAFLELIRPIATVVSSGDDESHSHPRPDTLGTLGKHSRGSRSLIFSTELARSSPERITEPGKEIGRLLRRARKVVDTEGAERETAQAALEADLAQVIQRSVQVYGLITLRTDGEKILLAQRLEKNRSTTSKWDIYPIERIRGNLNFVSRHAEH